MLILEGADNLGKTIAAKKLLEMTTSYPTYYSHMSRPNKNFNFCSHYKDMMSYFAIQDQFHLSGLVYQGAIDKDQLNLIESWLGVYGTYTVVFVGSSKWYEGRAKQRKEMFDPDELQRVNSVYRRIALGQHELHPKIDYVVKVGPDSFVSDETLKDIYNQWYNRLMTAFNHKGIM